MTTTHAAQPAPLDAPVAVKPRSPGELFVAFNKLALQGFGGVLPVAQRELVERRRWLTKAEFLELLSAGQVLPGPNVCNMALMFGDRCFGWRGAFASLAGLLLAPTAIVIVLAVAYARFVHLPAVVGALRGMGAVASGLILSTGVKLLPTLRTNPMGPGVATTLGAIAVVAIAAFRVPLVWIVAGLGSVSMAFAWWKLRRATGTGR